MKKIVLITALLGAMLTATAYIVCVAAPALFSGEALRGNGNIVTRTIEAPDFEKVDVSRAIHVVISDQLTDKINIAADDNVIEHVVVKAENGKLKVAFEPSIKSVSNINVTVTIPANGRIRSLDASSASKITSDVVLTADRFEMDASSAAKIKVAVKSVVCEIEASSSSSIIAQVETQSCEIKGKSASNITVKGSADKCSVDLSSASDLAAKEFVVKDLSIDTSSASDATVNCTEKLRASASSASDIRYTGNCTKSIKQSSAGKVRQK